MGRPLYDIANRRFGLLTVIRREAFHGKELSWLCKCDCGTSKIIAGHNLRHGRTTSCGCNQLKYGKNNSSYRHGVSATPEHMAYRAALAPCRNPKHPMYSEYGGRGIEFKFISFGEWFTALGPRPTSTHSVDRIDNNGPYSADNIRWSTKREQSLNRRKYNTITKFSDDELCLELQRRGYHIGNK